MKNFSEKYFTLVKRLIPEKEATALVGLDIGTNSCKMVELRKNGDAFELANWAVEPIVNADVRQSVKNVLSRLLVPCASPATAVFGKGTLNRYIDMPKMSLEELRKSLALEADKYFPFPADQIYTDCYILDPKAKDNGMSVLVVAAKKELIDKRIQLLTELGLQTSIIGLNSIAMANALNVLGIKSLDPAKSKEGAGIAVLDMGEMESNLTILVNMLPRFTRDIFVGGRDLTRNISNALGVPFAEAEQLKGSPGERLKDVLNACETVTLSLVSELRLSFDYFITERNIPITHLFLSGGGAMLQGVEAAFSKHLEIPVKIWNPVESLAVAPGVVADKLNRDSGKMAVALGLALYNQG